MESQEIFSFYVFAYITWKAFKPVLIKPFAYICLILQAHLTHFHHEEKKANFRFRRKIRITLFLEIKGYWSVFPS